MSKTLGDLSQQFSYINVSEGTIGVPLKYKEFTRDEVIDLVSEEKYQRLISASALKKQGVMNWSVLLPLVIAIRPDSVPSIESNIKELSIYKVKQINHIHVVLLNIQKGVL